MNQPDPVKTKTRTREGAIRDGALIAVPMLKVAEAGWSVPVAFTLAAWNDCVRWTDAETERTGAPNDEDGRLWDVFTMLRWATRRQPPREDRPTVVPVCRVSPDHDLADGDPEPEDTTLHAWFVYGDDGEPVITFTLPGES